MPVSTPEVVEAVQDAVSSGRRLVVRSGGHCLEGFVSDPAACLYPMNRQTAV
ncbi:hypothetical protein [Chitinophaga alhagiae]|uniref:hypothetical protein n=1 Tax=Chitinophaga alhagiae TaxID=2203219 RepID=UPI001300A2D8|nr:hypothetical protein [Chitinophaga alhagiae]